MSRLLKAFLISALATASAALVMTWLDDDPSRTSGADAEGTDESDPVEALDSDMRAALLSELDAQV